MSLLFRVQVTTNRPGLIKMFGGTVLKVEGFRKIAGVIYREKMKNKLCDMAKSKSEQNKYVKVAKDLNLMNDKMIPIKRDFMKAMVAASKPESRISGADLVW